MILKKIFTHPLQFGFLIFISFPSSAQCLEGNCANGYGKMDNGKSTYIGQFKNGETYGVGAHYDRVSGNVRTQIHDSKSTFAIVEFHNGTLEFGFRKAKELGRPNLLYNGFAVQGTTLYKQENSFDRQPMDFDFKSDRCLFGDCSNGLGGQFKSVREADGKIFYYLYMGYFKDGKYEGEGGWLATLSDFKSGSMEIGYFSAGKLVNGVSNWEDKNKNFYLFIENQHPVVSYDYEVPDHPPLADAATNPGTPPRKRHTFLSILGGVAVAAVVVVGTVALSEPHAAKQQGSPAGTGSVKCKYYVFWWTENNDTKMIIEGVGTAAESTARIMQNTKTLGTTQWFDSFQRAADFKMEKATAASSRGYEIGYKYASATATNCANK